MYSSHILSVGGFAGVELDILYNRKSFDFYWKCTVAQKFLLSTHPPTYIYIYICIGDPPKVLERILYTALLHSELLI